MVNLWVHPGAAIANAVVIESWMKLRLCMRWKREVSVAIVARARNGHTR
jgi:hypothetical protein